MDAADRARILAMMHRNNDRLQTLIGELLDLVGARSRYVSQRPRLMIFLLPPEAAAGSPPLGQLHHHRRRRSRDSVVETLPLRFGQRFEVVLQRTRPA